VEPDLRTGWFGLRIESPVIAHRPPDLAIHLSDTADPQISVIESRHLNPMRAFASIG